MFAKKIRYIILPLILFFAGISYGEMSAYDIMKKAYAIDDEGKTIKMTVKLDYIKKGELTKATKLIRVQKKYPDMEKTLVVFTEPADVAGVSFLNIKYLEEGKDDDQWLYMPALKKVRRISASSKGEYFMGTEYAYEDMAGNASADDDIQTMLGSEVVNGKDCYKIKCVPKDPDSAYSKKIYYIDKELFTNHRVEFFDRDEEPLKILAFRKWEKIDGIWTLVDSEMKNIQKDRASVLQYSDIKYNIPFDESVFTQRTLQNAIQKLSAL